jgi:hypothetical protein
MSGRSESISDKPVTRPLELLPHNPNFVAYGNMIPKNGNRAGQPLFRKDLPECRCPSPYGTPKALKIFQQIVQKGHRSNESYGP